MKHYILGIDTGGTYTDGVLLDAASQAACAKTKARTTNQDYAIGIRGCLEALRIPDYSAVELVCISTTLATNAVVEGRSGRVALLTMGGHIEQALPCAWQRQLRGRLNIKGIELEPLDEAEVRAAAAEIAAGDFDAAAISGFASVRNPAHERRVRALVQEAAGLPVVCAHELSSALGFYERTVTAALNAGLLGYIRALCDAVERVIRSCGITAPVMIGKGDGSMMDADYACLRPIETILSGPAASISGGLFLSGRQDAVIADIGGTTTDIACARDGHVALSEHGACVGGWRTQVRAAEISTSGLGGDSHITLRDGLLRIGPRRVLPLSAAAEQWPQLLRELESTPEETPLAELECLTPRQAPHRRQGWTELDCRLTELVEREAHTVRVLCAQLGCTAAEILDSAPLREGVLQLSGLTPTDLLHVRGTYAPWNREAPARVLRRLAAELGTTPVQALVFAYGQVIDALRDACGAAMEASGAEPGLLVGIGAPAETWMRALQVREGWPVLVPEHAEVANAVGAAVSQVSERAQAIIRPDQEHRGFLVHLPDRLLRAPTLERAAETGEAELRRWLETQAARAGGGDCTVCLTRRDLYAEDAEASFIETRLEGMASGLPRWRH